jgi:hypothetical protein
MPSAEEKVYYSVDSIEANDIYEQTLSKGRKHGQDKNQKCCLQRGLGGQIILTDVYIFYSPYR